MRTNRRPWESICHTPASATLVTLNEQIKWLNGNGGLAWAAARTATSAAKPYDWAERSPIATPFVSRPQDRSRVIATIDFDPAIDAAGLAFALRASGILDVEPYRKLGRNQLRVATFVTIEPEDVDSLVQCIDFVLERMTR